MPDASRRPPLVLVVDDNEDDIELVRLATRRADASCRVVGARSGEDALRWLRDAEAERPDLVLLDWKMPATSGEETLRALRGEGHAEPVLVFSSSDAPEDVARAYAAGATAYVPKPDDLEGYTGLARDLFSLWRRVRPRPR